MPASFVNDSETPRAEMMLALAPFVGVDLKALELVRRRLEVLGAMLDAAGDKSRRVELDRLMFADVAELASAYKMLARAVERGGDA